MFPTRCRHWLQFCGSENNRLLHPVFFLFKRSDLNLPQASPRKENPLLLWATEAVFLQTASHSLERLILPPQVLQRVSLFPRLQFRLTKRINENRSYRLFTPKLSIQVIVCREAYSSINTNGIDPRVPTVHLLPISHQMISQYRTMWTHLV